MAKCAHCRKTLAGDVVEAGGLVFHPGCFKCAGCSKPIQGQFIQKNGHPWHQACYLKKHAKHCPVCRQPITGSYLDKDGKAYHPSCFENNVAPRCDRCAKPVNGGVTALGKTWHPACFQCAGCNRPISERQFQTQDGQPYHASCHAQKFAKKCDACGQPLVGKYQVDLYGNQFHPEHQKQLPSCCSCDRLICHAVTGGGRVYSDQRHICNLCFPSAVTDQAQAEQIFDQVRMGMREMGFEFGDRHLPLSLTDAPTLKSWSNKGRKDHPVLGLTRAQIKKRGSHVVAKNFQGVYIVFGLPREHFETVAAHELCHAWLLFNRFYDLPEKVEEGLCTLCEDLWLSRKDDAMARIRRQRLERNPDRIYGDGFRMAKKAADKVPLPKLLAYVRKHRAFPNAFTAMFI